MLNIDIAYSEFAIVRIKIITWIILVEGILLNRGSLRTNLFLAYWRQLQHILKVAFGLTHRLGGEVKFVGMGVWVIEVVYVGELDILKLHEVKMDHRLRWTVIHWNFGHLIIIPERLTRFDAKGIGFQVGVVR